MDRQRSIVVVTGRRCAGKSTVGQLIRANGGFWIEASSHVAKMKAQAEYRTPEKLWNAIESGIVARLACEEINLIGAGLQPIVVTGLRYRSELNILATRFRLSVVTIEASSYLRYRRNVLRAREDLIIDWSDWERAERQDDQFDLLCKPTGQLFRNESRLSELVVLVRQIEDGVVSALSPLSIASL